MRIGRVASFALAVVLLSGACDSQIPSTSPAHTSSPAQTPTPTSAAGPSITPAATVQPSAGDLPDLDPVAIFGPGVKLTGTEDHLLEGVSTGAVLDVTGSSFGVATECVGRGPLIVEVSRPILHPERGSLPYEILANYRVACPTSVVETLTNDTGEVGPRTQLNVGVQDEPDGRYWRVILVDLRP